MAESEQTRRTILKVVTLSIGGAVSAALGAPAIRYLLFPVGRRVVSSAVEPVDVGPGGAVRAGGPPVRVQLRARELRDAWGVTSDVPLGAAWLARSHDGALRALSTTCPHLGCAIDFDAQSGQFRCPCHTSSFAADGRRLDGPAKRGMDPLPVQEQDGRVLVTFKRYRGDVAEREET